MSTPPQPFDKFTLWWAAYPKRVAKGDARKAFAKLKPDDALFARMLEALAWQREQPEWTRDHGQYIPYPGTYLRQERWEDERVIVKTERTRVNWRDECAEMHGGRCSNVHYHEAVKAS